MRTQPDALPPDAVARLLGDGWSVVVAKIEYRPVGFGSHHWEAVDLDGARWFVTADDLDSKRSALSGPADEAFNRLRAALATAGDLRGIGANFVVAPIPTVAGEPLLRANRRFGVALYPYVDGQSFTWGAFSAPAHRQAVLDLVVALHAAPLEATRRAFTDDFALPHRDDLESALRDGIEPECGPYALPASALVIERADKIRQLLVRYDTLSGEFRQRPRQLVVTHGEPHPGNTMLTAKGWVLIDWDTVLLAPPERDLWMLDPGDGSILATYERATGTTPDPATLDLYRIRWDLADICAYVSRFEQVHSGTEDDEQSWEDLRSLVERIPND